MARLRCCVILVEYSTLPSTVVCLCREIYCWEIGPSDRCSPCPIGTVISTIGAIVGNDFAGIWGNLNAAGPSFFDFTGPNVVLTLGLVQADFTFRVALCGVRTPVGGGIPIPCAINLPVLTGIGKVLLEVRPAFPGSSDVRILSNSYVFTVPEPSFVILVGRALLGVRVSKNRR